MIKGIIFDMDGVIVDSENFYFDAFVEMIENDGKKVDIENFKTIIGKSHENSLAMIGAHYDENFDGKLFLDRFEKKYKTNGFTYKDILFPYVIPVLEKLKNDGFKIALASSSLRNVIERALVECEIKDYFEDDAKEAYEDAQAYNRDPYGYYGMSQSDFI